MSFSHLCAYLQIFRLKFGIFFSIHRTFPFPYYSIPPPHFIPVMIRHHHHQFLLSLRTHRASTKHRHLVLFPAILLTSLQLFPFSNASLWTVLHHVCLGLPLLLFPCGFQSKASLSMASCPFLSECPIQFHFRFLICVDISISPVPLQSSSFETTSGQWMFRIRRKQQLTKVCSFEVVVFISFHVSDPYNNIDLTLLWKMRSLVLVDNLLFFHTG